MQRCPRRLTQRQSSTFIDFDLTLHQQIDLSHVYLRRATFPDIRNIAARKLTGMLFHELEESFAILQNGISSSGMSSALTGGLTTSTGALLVPNT